MSPDLLPAAFAYAGFWAELRPDTVGRIRDLAAPAIRFRDPFNDLAGIDRVEGMLRHMFEVLDEVRFEMGPVAAAGEVAFIRWDFHCRPRRLRRSLVIEGVSEVHFDRQGLVTAHLDHWDAAGQLYERVPLLGGLLRGLRRRLAYPG